MSLNRNPAILFLQGKIFQPKENIKMKRHGNVIIKKKLLQRFGLLPMQKLC